MKSEEITTIRKELKEKYNIETDRDLISQLGIEEEDKSKLFAWIRYQCAFSYQEGFDNGQDSLKYKLRDLLSCCQSNTRLSSNLKIMKTDTKQTSNEADCGNKSKPLLGEVYWTFNIEYLPVQVEILELDTENRMARISQGWISYDRLYESEDKCHQR